MNFWRSFIGPITAYFRRKRGKLLLELFPDIRDYKICDLGGSRHFWERLGLDINHANVTIYNISLSETSGHGRDLTEIPIMLYDGKHIPAQDKAFDLLICNSVIEHVAPSERKALAEEMVRVSKHVFCQTPAFEFPIEPHFVFPLIHWLPRNIGFYLAKISPWRFLSKPKPQMIHEYWWGTQLLTQAEIRSIFPSARILKERFAGLVKAYYIIIRETS